MHLRPYLYEKDDRYLKFINMVLRMKIQCMGYKVQGVGSRYRFSVAVAIFNAHGPFLLSAATVLPV